MIVFIVFVIQDLASVNFSSRMDEKLAPLSQTNLEAMDRY